MIQIKQLYIENFKGIEEGFTIDFTSGDTKVNILSGPNGFGKTTIFEAIEFCLTNRFGRKEIFAKTQDSRATPNKAHFHNDFERDVVLKLWLTRGDDSLIIVKTHEKRQRKESFTTYTTSDSDYFINDDYSQLEISTQQQIDDWVYDSNISLTNTFDLFNYLQQEENLFFLKKSEKEKGEQLSFLFNIREEEEKVESLKKTLKTLKVNIDTISSEQNNLREFMGNTEEQDYELLFPDNQFALDNENPFEDSPSPDNYELELLMDELDSLIELKKEFKVEEYEKKIKYRKTEVIINNTSLLQSLSLLNIYNESIVKEEVAKNKVIDEYRNFLNRPSKEEIPEKYFKIFFEEDTSYVEYVSTKNEIAQINLDLNAIGLIISDLIEARKKSVEEFDKLRTKDINVISDSSCPLCDTPFESYENLLERIQAKTLALEAYNKNKLVRKSILLERINAFSKLIEDRINEYLSKDSPLDSNMLNLFRELPNYIEESKKIQTRLAERNDSESISSLYFTSVPQSLEEMERKVDEIKKYFEDFILKSYLFDSASTNNADLYEKYFSKSKEKFEVITIEGLERKKLYIRFQFNSQLNLRLQSLSNKKEKILTIQIKVKSVEHKVKKILEEYKHEMVSKIQIPFYIYSGKILQNYQQGLGIFIEIKEGNNNVNFITGSESSNNIVYHLSSGQLAVVSIAFCLALNKVYSTNDNFKFIAIDDPVQTLDDLNVHTFIELLRHDFRDYQLLMSTHEDFTSKYMKYKLDKLGMATKIQNVQQLFFEV